MTSQGPLARLGDAWDRYWFGEGSLVRLGVFRIVILLAALHGVMQHRFGVLEPAHDVTVDYLLRRWEPIYAFDVLGIGPPGPIVARTMYGLTLAGIALGILGLATRAACAIAALGTVWWIGVAYSFGKPHHGAVALALGLLCLPFGPVGERVSLGACRRKRRGHELRDDAPFARFPVLFTAWTIALGYFFAGATKLAVGGLAWMNGYTLQAILLQFDAPWSAAMAADVRLTQLFSVGLIAIQILFPLVFLFPVSRWFFLPGALSFHLVAWQSMSTGTFLTLWILLVAFVPLERVPDWLAVRVGDGPGWRRILWGAGALGALAAFVAIYLRPMPSGLKPVLVALALVPALAFARRLSRGSLAPRSTPGSRAAGPGR